MGGDPSSPDTFLSLFQRAVNLCRPNPHYVVLAVVLVFFSLNVFTQLPRAGPPSSAASNLLITVTDENGSAVPSALVFLQAASGAPLKCQTDFAGHCSFSDLAVGSYQLRVQKPNFYVLSGEMVEVGRTSELTVALNHQQEVREVVKVVESPPAIDPHQRVGRAALARKRSAAAADTWGVAMLVPCRPQ